MGETHLGFDWTLHIAPLFSSLCSSLLTKDYSVGLSLYGSKYSSDTGLMSSKGRWIPSEIQFLTLVGQPILFQASRDSPSFLPKTHIIVHHLGDWPFVMDSGLVPWMWVFYPQPEGSIMTYPGHHVKHHDLKMTNLWHDRKWPKLAAESESEAYSQRSPIKFYLVLSWLFSGFCKFWGQ